MSERRPSVSPTRSLPALLALLAATAAWAGELPDPTRPPPAWLQPPEAAEPIRTEDWSVRSILVAPSRRVAVINGRPFQEGETVDGAVVVSIRPTAVTLRRNGRTFEVGLAATGPSPTIPGTSGGNSKP